VLLTVQVDITRRSLLQCSFSLLTSGAGVPLERRNRLLNILLNQAIQDVCNFDFTLPRCNGDFE
jgi:hypothetical protein